MAREKSRLPARCSAINSLYRPSGVLPVARPRTISGFAAHGSGNHASGFAADFFVVFLDDNQHPVAFRRSTRIVPVETQRNRRITRLWRSER